MTLSLRQYKHLRRNIACFLCDYLMFGMAYSLIGTNSTIVPSFISEISDSKLLIGFTGSLYLISWLLPQLLFAQIVSRASRRKPFIHPVVFFRLTIIVAALVIGTIGAANPEGALTVFLIAYAVFALGDALISIAWGDLLGSSLPHAIRGTMFGVGQFAVAFGALGMSALARWALGKSGLPFPHNFVLLFGVAGILFLIGGVALALLKEEASPTPIETGPSLRRYIPYLGRILRQDRPFRRFITMRLFIDMAVMAAPFYAVFAIGTLAIPRDRLVGDSIILIQIGNATASLLMAYVSRRSGSRAVLLVAVTFAIIETGLALFSALSGGILLLHLAFIATGAFHGIIYAGYFDWVITYAPASDRPIYFGLSNTFGAVGNLGPVIGGAILQVVSRPALPDLRWLGWGITPVSVTPYAVVFTVALGLAVIGLVGVLRLPEPRPLAAQRDLAAAAG